MLRQAHGYKRLRRERVPLEYRNVQQLFTIVSILILIQVQVAPGARQTYARLMRAQVPGRTDERVHDGPRWLLAWRKAV